MSHKILFVACVAAVLIALVAGQQWSQEKCQKASQGAGAKVAKAMREEMRKFQSKMQQLAQSSVNMDQMSEQVEQIMQNIDPLVDSSSKGEMSVQQIQNMMTSVSSQYIKLGTSLMNTRAPIEAYSAYFDFLFSVGNRMTDIMRQVQQACSPSQ